MSDAENAVVIVEDDVAMRQAIERVLRARGIELSSYGSAEAALSSASMAKARCLIVDIRLPGMSGIEMCERIARDGHLPPVVFITAQDEPHLRRAAQRLGAVATFVKPFSGRDLVDVVGNVLASPISNANGVAP